VNQGDSDVQGLRRARVVTYDPVVGQNSIRRPTQDRSIGGVDHGSSQLRAGDAATASGCRPDDWQPAAEPFGNRTFLLGRKADISTLV